MVPGKYTTHPSSKQILFLENKVNKLRWINDDLNKKVFDAIQRGHRLAAKLGYQDLDEAEHALATQVGEDAVESQQSQLQQLSQYPSDELALHVRALQTELISHVQLSKSTLGALGEALAEITGLREVNEKLKGELEKACVKRGGVRVKEEEDKSSSTTLDDELAFVRAELASLKDKYNDLRKAKKEADDKHTEDYRRWKEFKQWLVEEEAKAAERETKRRKLNPPGDEGNDNKSVAGRVERQGQLTKVKKFGQWRKKLLTSGPRMGSTTSARAASTVSHSSPSRHAILTSRNLNSSSPSPPPSSIPTSSKQDDVPPVPHKIVKRNSTVIIPKENIPISSDTEPDSQPVKFLYPSQLSPIDELPATIPQKRARSPTHELSSSDTEPESQAPTFLFPSQMTPFNADQARVLDRTPKPKPKPVVRSAEQQLWTPVSAARPQQGRDGRCRSASSAAMPPPPSSPSRSSADPFCPTPRPLGENGGGKGKASLPDTPVSLVPKSKKGKERAAENDENSPTSAVPDRKKYPSDYSIYKGRGRYAAELRAGKETINALFEIDPERNDGVGFQYDEVVRDKEKRKHMKGGDCECCREYYKTIKPLPARLQPPMWRSPPSSPSKKGACDSLGDENKDGEGPSAIEEHINEISRHKEACPRALTPPGYWRIGLPDTQEVAKINAEAERMHERKRIMVAEEAERGGKYKKR